MTFSHSYGNITEFSKKNFFTEFEWSFLSFQCQIFFKYTEKIKSIQQLPPSKKENHQVIFFCTLVLLCISKKKPTKQASKDNPFIFNEKNIFFTIYFLSIRIQKLKKFCYLFLRFFLPIKNMKKKYWIELIQIERLVGLSIISIILYLNRFISSVYSINIEKKGNATIYVFLLVYFSYKCFCEKWIVLCIV